MRTPAKVRVGDAPDTRVVGPVSQTDIVRFAGAGGDFNPLHHDHEFVATSGFPGVIAMGQMQAGILAGWVSDTFGVEHVRAFGVRFVAPVFLGDTLTVGGTVVAITEADGESRANVDLVVSGAEGPVVTGSATVVVATT
ncbi:MaoC family dehydratase [Rhodococcus sp. LB1]|uniref:MaoC family dehydratase n=1 Tax=Rhodococcus sp. LB1 TaxID=1807499 RepID=UPI00077AA5A2|nr:MaoC/PaaZ C-terminal domain-containing protein [Rhodococcus sp. LB1]KXX56034.1 acyl dehydratase [Rhodococcus sp. LB1]